MSVRSFALGCAVALLLTSPLANAQRPGKVPRIGFAVPGPAVLTLGTYRAFIDEMRARGYVEGRDFVMEIRSTDGKPERFPQLMADLVQVPVDVILVGVCGLPVNAARRARPTIPPVMRLQADEIIE